MPGSNAKASSQHNKSHKTGKHAPKGQRHKQRESKGARPLCAVRRVGPAPAAAVLKLRRARARELLAAETDASMDLRAR